MKEYSLFSSIAGSLIGLVDETGIEFTDWTVEQPAIKVNEIITTIMATFFIFSPFPFDFYFRQISL
ncbi:MAG TPA: hypothetical protein DCE78_07150 [Bacteroidetes bacterium]|nr:hypothetical protein [Bacteroidota bacterium]